MASTFRINFMRAATKESQNHLFSTAALKTGANEIPLAKTNCVREATPCLSQRCPSGERILGSNSVSKPAFRQLPITGSDFYKFCTINFTNSFTFSGYVYAGTLRLMFNCIMGFVVLRTQTYETAFYRIRLWAH